MLQVCFNNSLQCKSAKDGLAATLNNRGTRLSCLWSGVSLMLKMRHEAMNISLLHQSTEMLPNTSIPVETATSSLMFGILQVCGPKAP